MTRRNWGMPAVVLLLIACLPSSALSKNSYSFVLDRVEDGTVHFRGDTGCPWKAVGYKGGCFLVSEQGVITSACHPPEVDRPGIVVQLMASDSTLALTCYAKDCAIETTPQHGKAATQHLQREGTTTVPTSARVVFTVSR